MTEPARLSTFVTVVGWLVAMFSGLSVLVSLLQGAILAFAVPFSPVSDSEAATIPFGMAFIFDNLQWIALLLALFWAVVLAAAVAMLKRKEWGRQALFGCFVLFALATVAIALAQQILMSQLFVGAEVPADAASMLLAMRTGSAVFALVFTAAFTWVAIRLNSARTRAEFQIASDPVVR